MHFKRTLPQRILDRVLNIQQVALAKLDLPTIQSREEKLAFWMNTYNDLTQAAIAHFGLKKTMLDVTYVFEKAIYNIGGFRFSMDDIEHGILRANRGNPFLFSPQFPQNDPRLPLIMDKLDFRIHFALNCGAESCPPIRRYTTDKIDAQLDLAAGNFLNGADVEIDIQNKRVILSKILQWYSQDFGAGKWYKFGIGSPASILRTIAPYMVDEEKRAFLENHAETIQVKFKPYSWKIPY